MAKNLTDKLNTLIRSSVQGVLGDMTPHSRRHGQPPLKLGKDIDREIAALRQQIDKALDDEDRMTADIATLQRQIADWDQQADRALTKGDEATARYAVRQIQLQQQRQTMLEAELAQHRFSTSELISRVNELEAVVAQARRQQQQETDEDPAEETLSARLRQARQEITAQPVDVVQDVPTAVDDQVIEDDLARRRARLSQ